MSWTVVQVPGEKITMLGEHIEKALRHAGKAMQCIDEMKRSHGMGERGMRSMDYGDRGDYGGRGGYRDDEYPMHHEMGDRRFDPYMHPMYPMMGMREDEYYGDRRDSMGRYARR